MVADDHEGAVGSLKNLVFVLNELHIFERNGEAAEFADNDLQIPADRLEFTGGELLQGRAAEGNIPFGDVAGEKSWIAWYGHGFPRGYSLSAGQRNLFRPPRPSPAGDDGTMTRKAPGTTDNSTGKV